MAKLFFNSENCQGATSARTGKSYDTDKKGFINVTDPVDVAFFKKNGGYIEAGSMPLVKSYWTCDNCNWDAVINSCGRCGSDSLRKIET
jgi:hypothetical protein